MSNGNDSTNNKHSICIRFILTILYIGVLYCNELYFKSDKEDSIFTGKYALLTHLNLVFLAGCLIYSLLCSCLVPERSSLHSLDGALAGVSCTMSMLVAALFWIIYAVDRELIYPSWLDEVVPTWHNHALHTVIVPASFINFCLVSRGHTPSFRALLLSSITAALSYVAWIHAIHHVTGTWVYPLLELLSAQQRPLFIAACCVAVVPFAAAASKLQSAAVRRRGNGCYGDRLGKKASGTAATAAARVHSQ